MKTKVQLYTSEKAKQYRLDADMSLRYLGDCLNVSHTFIHDVEDPEKDQAYNLLILKLVINILANVTLFAHFKTTAVLTNF